MMDNEAKIFAISVSEQTGEPKHNVESATLKEEFGIVGDAHGGTDRQVSLLSMESVRKMQEQGADVNPGDFAENITTLGFDMSGLKIGDRIQINHSVILEVTQIGKTCHDRCRIYEEVGDCIMPVEGVFTRVIQGGTIKPGDPVEMVS